MKLKTVPEDFVVEEVMELDIGDGPYTYFKLNKKNWNTMDVLKKIADILHKKEKDLNIAGIKDKSAVTSQYVSAYMVSADRLNTINIEDVKIEVLGAGKERIHLGKLDGNRFTIVMRDLDDEFFGRVDWIVNYFDSQRFGVENKNHLIGKALVKKNFAEACSLLGLDVEKNDHIGALRKHGIKKLKLYVHAYQSFLWNKLASLNVSKRKHKMKDCGFGKLAFPLEDLSYVDLPLLGFLYKGEEYDEIMEEEGLTTRDFIIPQLNELSSEGGVRPMLVAVENFKLGKAEKDELNEGKLKQEVSFFLRGGAYATMVIKSLETLQEL